LTLDRPASHFTIELGTKRNAVQLSFVPLWEWFSLLLEHPHGAAILRLNHFLWSISPASSLGFGCRTSWIRFDRKPRSITSVTDLGIVAIYQPEGWGKGYPFVAFRYKKEPSSGEAGREQYQLFDTPEYIYREFVTDGGSHRPVGLVPQSARRSR
jgi:hypothetical protein